MPVITSSKLSEGWKLRSIIVGSRTTDVVVSPYGIEYIRAKDNERADVIVDHTKGKYKELGQSRWRKLEGSGTARQAKKENADVANGTIAHKAKRTAKREKRLARKKKPRTPARRL